MKPKRKSDVYHNLTEIQQKIYNCIKENETIIRKDLVDNLNMPRTTIYDNLAKLKKKKLITNFRKCKEIKKGTPNIFWCLIDFPLIEYYKNQHKKQKEETKIRSLKRLKERFSNENKR